MPRLKSTLHSLSWLGDTELYEASFTNLSFAKHMHETYAIGSICGGVGGYHCKGARHVLPPNTLSLMNPGEPHTGYALSGLLEYKMLYVSESWVSHILGIEHVPKFKEVVTSDDRTKLGSVLAALAQSVRTPHYSGWHLSVESLLVSALQSVFSQFGGAPRQFNKKEPRAIAEVREYIESKLNDAPDKSISLLELAALTDLHPNYLLKIFTCHMGVTPYAYLIQRRLSEAKRMILAGERSAEVACKLGFFDQAHLIRHFRRVYGVTPSRLIRQ